ncbi:Rrf2 family transcriptional regulator [Ileibacterium valens]|mgnify:CR=1 FL=1|uniref:Transcriptional regulator n=1 Tax=Ileibacterium valens TaxID=1862668 RepID=A0A1U7NI08_9FIRM|nr:Rrf2 family transcriptional regulator [Ileibacterium valens]OLU39665.1 hypothetical protein BO224_06990 [Erysipelotrichaceae bacterium NYU-BL-E8]OLU41600.1 hypothetical protein BM735_03915 [Erysipelotrichaceae bacterium NYU-BL-F16]OLU41764.1 hypothetical protein BO222_02710 [Ileibacterium valens]
MNYSTRTADAVHLLVLIHQGQVDLVSEALAKSMASSPAHIRKLMAKLKKGNLIQSRQGKACPKLAKDPKEITLLDIYQIMEDGKCILHLDTHTNPDCQHGIYIQKVLQENYDSLQNKFEQELNSITLQSLIDQYCEKLQQIK